MDETDHLHKQYRSCKKNPGHTKFIPLHDFKIEHLPPDCRDDLVLKLIRAEADMTCRLSMRYTSESRPKFVPERTYFFYPFSQDRGRDSTRTGTGWVSSVKMYTEKDGIICRCEECSQPGTHTPKKEWGEVYINTACHVVFDSDEAKHTTCYFFYDSGTTHISQCPSLTRFRVVEADMKENWCEMVCVSHDMDLVEKMSKMSNHRDTLRDKVYEKYKSVPDPTSTSRLAVIVSHPHGLNKQVTVGMWTHREIVSPPTCKDESGYELVGTSYRYNAATCAGSGGAPVIRLVEGGRNRHLHSEGSDGNNNKCGVRKELLPTSSVVM